MKSSMVATLGGLAVLGRAQQSTTQPTSVRTIAAIAVSHDGAKVTKENIASVATVHPHGKSRTCHTTVINGETRTLCEKLEPTAGDLPHNHHGSVVPAFPDEHDRYPDVPPDAPHGWVQPYIPEENRDIIVDPENACPHGYSCQLEYEHRPHGAVYKIEDDLEKCRSSCSHDDGPCHAGCDADQRAPPPSCRKHCGEGKCWAGCNDRPSSPRPQPLPVCPIGYTCRRDKHKHKEWKPPTPGPFPPPPAPPVPQPPPPSSSSVAPAPPPATVIPEPVIPTSSAPTVPGTPVPSVPVPSVPAPSVPAPSAPTSVVPAPVPPPPFYPTTITPAPAPVPTPSGVQPDQPHHKCPAGMHPCPHHHGNATTPPPASVTTAGAGYVQPVAGMAMIVAGIFGLLMF